mmetsp:Transcript_24078/g.48055  ORF Transcript_24078/g.48055 Transcript_24078/m.48055 type:complete len:83 (-) Transcript_24078:42-290(-)
MQQPQEGDAAHVVKTHHAKSGHLFVARKNGASSNEKDEQEIQSEVEDDQCASHSSESLFSRVKQAHFMASKALLFRENFSNF